MPNAWGRGLFRNVAITTVCKEPGHGYKRTKPGCILRVLSVCCIVVQLNILKPNSATVGS